jgi:outer membrane protein assembly factor BamE (lipoprotein component of BamABCDE complex)
MRIASAASSILATAVLIGCATTDQPVEKIALLSPGMSKQDVSQVMGTPARTEFSESREAWHFCRTGYGSADEFAVVVFSDGKVVAAKNYTVTLADTGGARGDCSRFVRSVFR